jgi:osmotically inducible protein OsmC
MKRNASATSKGGLKDGQGNLSTDSSVLSNTPYSFSTRFENVKGTNPEELIAAAHAGCFTMALSAQLGTAGFVPESLETTAALTMDKLDAGWTITTIHLDVKAKVPGASQEAFQAAANTAKANCPVSRALNAKITLNASLETQAQGAGRTQ